MNGDNINSYSPANFREHDGNQLQGALAFGVDLAQPPLIAQTYRQSGTQNIFQVGENPGLTFNNESQVNANNILAQTYSQSGRQNVFQIGEHPGLNFNNESQVNANNIFRVGDYFPIPKVTINNEGPIGSMSLPPGWVKTIPGSPPRGTYQFRVTPPGANPFAVTSGQSFIPPDHIQDPSVEIHVGRNMDPVQPQAEAALRQVLLSKPATDGEQPLTAQEFKAVAPIMGAQDGGNNQFNDLGTHGPKFEVTSASTINVQGRTALLVKGNFLNPDGTPSTRARESIFIDSSQAGTAPGAIEQIYLNAPPAKIQQYDHQFWNTVNSIQWAPRAQSTNVFTVSPINE